MFVVVELSVFTFYYQGWPIGVLEHVSGTCIKPSK
jgi:hypothetical protein